jgi:hypothetical protein
MSPSTVAYAEAARLARIQSDARVLRVIHHRHTAKFAAHARIIGLHAKTLLKLQTQIKKEAVAIAFADYKEYYDVGYDEYGSM